MPSSMENHLPSFSDSPLVGLREANIYQYMRGVSRFACLSRPLVLHYWLIQRNTNRTVVAAHLAGVDVGAGDAWGDCRRG